MVPENFWEDVKELMVSHFREDDFGQGMVEGIARIGEKLPRILPFGSPMTPTSSRTRSPLATEEKPAHPTQNSH